MKLIFNNKLNDLPRENPEGNVEYKFKLIKVTKVKIDKLTSQMLYRFMQGDGTAYYYLGVMDDGKSIGLNIDEVYITINCILDCLYELEGRVESIRIFNQGEEKYCLYVKIKKDKLPNLKIKL